MTEEVQGATAEAAPVTAQKETVKDSAQSAESKPELTPEQRAEAAEKAKAALEKRVARQTAAYRDLQRKYEEGRKVDPNSQQKPQAQQAPKEDDFKTTEEYLIAKGKYEARQEFEAEIQQKTQAEQLAAHQKKMFEVQQKISTLEAEMRETAPDYDEVVEVVNMAIAAAPEGMGKSAFAQYLLEAENQPKLAYELGNNPELLDKLATLSPVGIIKELTKFEMGLGNAPQRIETKPKPPKPVQGTGKASSSINTNMSGKELLKRLKI